MKRILHWLNPVARLQARRIRKAADQHVAEMDEWRRIVEGNPGLHAQILLRGDRFRHYLLTEDVARIGAGSVTESEVKSHFN